MSSTERFDRFPDEDELEQLVDENEPAYSIYWDSDVDIANSIGRVLL